MCSVAPAVTTLAAAFHLASMRMGTEAEEEVLAEEVKAKGVSQAS